MLTKEKLHLYYDPASSGCWIWNKTRYSSGYGRFSGTNAHRVVWRLYNGPVPAKLFVLHKCDVPACVNPDHLFLGTQKDNLQDMAVKGRSGKSKLSAEQIPTIREQAHELLKTHSITSVCKQIGTLYGVSKGAVESILDNRSWTHVAR